MKYVITGVGAKNGLGVKIIEALKEAHQDDIEIIAVCAPGNFPEVEVDNIYYCDLGDVIETIEAFSEISDEHPLVDCLINCAGANRMDWFEDVIPSEFMNVMNVNCNSAIFATQQLLPSLSEAKGTVLNIISMGAHRAFRTSLAYNVSKAGLKMANEQLARELNSKFGITVFGISPNELAGTGMTLENEPEICRVRGWSPEEAEEYRVKTSGQAANQTKPEQLAEFIAFLLHKKENHAMMNGVDLYYGD